MYSKPVTLKPGQMFQLFQESRSGDILWHEEYLNEKLYKTGQSHLAAS